MKLLKLTLHDHESLESLFVATTLQLITVYVFNYSQFLPMLNLSMFVNKPSSEIEDGEED